MAAETYFDRVGDGDGRKDNGRQSMGPNDGHMENALGGTTLASC